MSNRKRRTSSFTFWAIVQTLPRTRGKLTCRN